MKVQVTSSKRTRAPYRIDTLLTESIALNCTVKIAKLRSRDRKNFLYPSAIEKASKGYAASGGLVLGVNLTFT